jgi:phosphate transport system protein
MASRASRRASGSAGFVADLERIGDHACGIAKRALELNRLPALESRVDLAKLATLVQNNLQPALDSFAYKGADRATKVITADAEIDKLNKLNASLFAELIAHVAIDPATVTRVLPLTSVCRYLEPIGDHVKNSPRTSYTWFVPRMCGTVRLCRQLSAGN